MSRKRTQIAQSPRDVSTIETVSVACKCGRTHTVDKIQHYDRVLLECGRPYFALRPQRYGPLKLVPWPGPNLTRDEMAAKELAEAN